jgi:hypothetical protein
MTTGGRRLVWSVLLFATVLGASGAHAQSLWLDRAARRSLEVETLFAHRNDDGPAVRTAFLSLRAPVGSSTHFVLEVPAAARAKLTGLGGGSIAPAEFNLGNPYAGFELRPAAIPMWFEVGARIPLAGFADDPVAVAPLADLDREEAFLPDQLPVRIAVHGGAETHGRTRLRFDLRVAPVLSFAVFDEATTVERRLDLGYGGTARLLARDARLGIGWLGRSTVAGRAVIPAAQQLDLAADFTPFVLRPGLAWRVPLHAAEPTGVRGSIALTLTTSFGAREATAF